MENMLENKKIIKLVIIFLLVLLMSFAVISFPSSIAQSETEQEIISIR